MSEGLAEEIGARAARTDISQRTAHLLITGTLPAASQEVGPDPAAVQERAELTQISTATAALLLAPTSQSLGMLARAEGSAPQ